MHSLAPYVEAHDFIRARANVRGQQCDVIVLGWRGQRVYLSWRTDMGRHLGRVQAADVEGVCGRSRRFGS